MYVCALFIPLQTDATLCQPRVPFDLGAGEEQDGPHAIVLPARSRLDGIGLGRGKPPAYFCRKDWKGSNVII